MSGVRRAAARRGVVVRPAMVVAQAGWAFAVSCLIATAAVQAQSASGWRVAPAIVTSLEGGPAVCLNADAGASGGFRAEAFRGDATPRCENLVLFGADSREAALAFPGIVGAERYNCKGLQLASAHPCNSGFFSGPVEARTLDAGRLAEVIGASGAGDIAQASIDAWRQQQAVAARPAPPAAPPAGGTAPVPAGPAYGPPPAGGPAYGPPGVPAVVLVPGMPGGPMPGASAYGPSGAPGAGASPYAGGGGLGGGVPSSLMMPAQRPPQYLDLLRCISVAEAMQSMVTTAGRGQERAYWSGEQLRLQQQLTAMSRSMGADPRTVGADMMTTRPMAQQAYLGGARDGDRGTFLEVDLGYCRGRGLLR